MIAQDSLTITPTVNGGFTNFTIQKTGNTLNFTDTQNAGNVAVASAAQTAGTFNPGLVPFALSGSWVVQVGDQGASPSIACTTQVSAGQINATCNGVNGDGGMSPWFAYTTGQAQTASSLFGDLGGTWNNVWTNYNVDGSDAGSNQCLLDFAGATINTCASGGSILEQIQFTYDGNTVSGMAQGTEFTATRQ